MVPSHIATDACRDCSVLFVANTHSDVFNLLLEVPMRDLLSPLGHVN